MHSTGQTIDQQIIALERQLALIREEQTRARRALDVLYRVSLACRSSTSFREIFAATVEEVSAIFPLDACYIAVCDMREPGMFSAAYMLDEGVSEYRESLPYGSLTGLLVSERVPLLYHDLAAERSGFQQPPDMFGNEQKLSRAWLGVPLLLGQDALGVISIQSYQPGMYDQESRELLQRIGNVVAVALENTSLAQHQRELRAELEERFNARTRELDALGQLAAALVLQRPIQELLDHALSLILPLLDAQAGNVRRYVREQDALVLLAQRGLPPDDARAVASVPVSRSTIGSVVRDNRPLVVSENLSLYSLSPAPSLFHSLLGVPLRIGDQVLGSLVVLDTHPRVFSQAQIDLAQVIGNQVALAIENARLLEERERQIHELQALSAISQSASTSLNLNALLREVYQSLVGLMALEVFVMTVYDPQRQVIVDAIGIDEGETYTYFATNEPLPSKSFTAWVIRNRRTLHLNNVAQEISNYPDLGNVLSGSGRQSVSWLGVPLLDRTEQVIGAIVVQAYSEAAFSAGDERFLQTVASQAALHVQNVRLLSQRERQIRELDAIGRISQVMTATFDLQAMMRIVYEELQLLTSASSFFLIVCDAQSLEIIHAFYIDGGEQVYHSWPDKRPPRGSLTEWIFERCRPLLFVDIPTQSEDLSALGIMPRAYGSDTQPRSWAGVPLLTENNRPIGVMALQDSRPYQYDQQTIDFLTQVAGHISLGVQKVHLFEERERQIDANARLFVEAQEHAATAERHSRRMELVHRISLALSGRLDQQEILNLAVQELRGLFDSDHTGVLLFDEEGRFGTLVADYPPRDLIGGQLPLNDNPIIDEMIATQRPVCITSITSDPRAWRVRENLLQSGVESMMAAPLISLGRMIGSLGVDSVGRQRVFTEEEQNLLLTVASAIAAAIENARLFAAEQEARRTADTLREVARVLSSSFDFYQVLEIILAELQRVIPYDTASIMLLEGRALRIAAHHGWDEHHSPSGKSFPLDRHTGAGMAVAQRSPLMIADTTIAEAWRQHEIGAHIRSWLGVPLIAKGTVLGVLNIDSRRPNRFTPRDMDVALAFARQAAVAMENARLYQESVTRVEQELAIARQIQSNLFPRTLPQIAGLSLAALCIPARETGGDFYDCLELGDPEEQNLAIIVGDASGKSIPGAMLMAVARSVARSEARDHRTPETVMRETNRWIAGDVPHGTFVALAYATIDRRALRIAYSSAGQLAPLRRNAAGMIEYLEVSGPTLPLGIRPDIAYAAESVILAPGDTLVFYTDGVVEAHNAERELFGFERLEMLVREYGDLPPGQLVEQVLAAVATFVGATPPHDDMTLVVVRIE